MELLIREIPNEYVYKREYLDENSSKVEILILGGSHSYYGINPDCFSKRAFNASHVSQSIDYDFEIIKKYQDSWDHLEYIIIPVDYLTLFSQVAISIESWRVKNYEIYYNINRSLRLSDRFEILSFSPITSFGRIRSYYCDHISPVTISELGFGNAITERRDMDSTGMLAARRHIESSDERCYENNMAIVKEIIDFAYLNGIRILFFTPPAHQSYISNLDQSQLDKTIHSIEMIAEAHSNCSYHSFLNSNIFDIQDFMDADHLSIGGAEKLSAKLNDVIV